MSSLLRHSSGLLLLTILSLPRSAGAQSVPSEKPAEGEVVTVPLLERLTRGQTEYHVFEKVQDGVIIKPVPRVKAWLGLTSTQVSMPMTWTMKLKTGGSGLDLMVGSSVWMFNGPNEPDTLIYRPSVADRIDPTVREYKLEKRGALPRNEWAVVELKLDVNKVTITVDGQERFNSQRKAGGNLPSVAFRPTGEDGVLFSSIEVRGAPRQRDTQPPQNNPPAQNNPQPKPPEPVDDGRVRVDVPTAPPPTNAEPSPAPAGNQKFDPNAIEHPAYRNKAKSFDRSVTSVTGMYVRIGNDGDQLGVTSDIIASVDRTPRGASASSVGFVHKDGDENMKVAFEEAARAVRMRYPYWATGRIDVSFGDKFTAHGGASAGTAFALLMLSTLEGFDIDPKCAVTGDISVNWRVRKVGGVTAKLRGATLDKCELACIPTDNEQAFVDMGLLYGNASLYEIQVFTVDTLQQATAVVRTDRSLELAEAVKLFDGLKIKLLADERETLKDPETIRTLERVLFLAPNHVSAKAVLALAKGTAPKFLSSNATIYRLSVLFYPYRTLLADNTKLTRDSLPAHVTQTARKRLAALRPIAAKQFQPAINEITGLIESMDRAANTGGNAALKNIDVRIKAVNTRLSELFGDAAFVEKFVREGY